MDFNEYQKLAKTTAIYKEILTRPNYPYFYTVFGLIGEAGEVAEKVKKWLRDGQPGKFGEVNSWRWQEIKKELGDVLWYLAMVADEFEMSLEEIAQENLDKLASRRERNVIHGEGDNR